ncbi:MAG: hypothetical protein HKO53_06190, partial [Gemmatimonadetes bacterium]|nr:hypothetical protein [Gemmatimonadota bacterium]
MTDPLGGRALRHRRLSPLLLPAGLLLPVLVWACDDALGVDTPEGAVAVLIEPQTLELVSFGDTVTLVATLVDAAGAPVSVGLVTWASSTPAVARVAPEEARGRVTSVGNGIAVITASTGGGLSASAVVIVAQRVSRLEIAGGGPLELGWIGAG